MAADGMQCLGNDGLDGKRLPLEVAGGALGAVERVEAGEQADPGEPVEPGEPAEPGESVEPAGPAEADDAEAAARAADGGGGCRWSGLWSGLAAPAGSGSQVAGIFGIGAAAHSRCIVSLGLVLGAPVTRARLVLTRVNPFWLVALSLDWP